MFGGFRFVLAVLVALSHYGLQQAGINPGQWSVIGFYVIAGYLMEASARKLAIGPAWSLALEMQYYLLVPVIVALSNSARRACCSRAWWCLPCRPGLQTTCSGPTTACPA